MYTSESYLAQTAHALRTGELDLRIYIEGLCKLITTREPYVKALLPEENIKDRLLSEAEKLKNSFPDPDKRPPLFGIPVGIKDIINADGFETKAGTNLPPKLFKGNEASVVSKLKKAGAIILGKTVTTEFAYYEPGETRNPHNIEYTPGGSSSGSAAAVASGFTPLAIGTQTIGSVIRPAAYCGIIGFKPSFDRIPTDGVIPFSVSVDHLGIFTQDIEGIDLAASIICNNWQMAYSVNRKPVIGAVSGNYLNQAEPEIIDFFEKKLEELNKNGFEIKRICPLENIKEINEKHLTINAFEFSSVHKAWFKNYQELYRSKTKELILKGKDIKIEQLEIAKKGRIELRNHLETIKSSYGTDVCLSPATTSPAPKGMQTGSPLMNLPWTYSGLPVITIPAGKSKDNLPIGLQITGAFNQDEKLLSFTKFINDILVQ